MPPVLATRRLGNSKLGCRAGYRALAFCAPRSPGQQDLETSVVLGLPSGLTPSFVCIGNAIYTPPLRPKCLDTNSIFSTRGGRRVGLTHNHRPMTGVDVLPRCRLLCSLPHSCASPRPQCRKACVQCCPLRRALFDIGCPPSYTIPLPVPEPRRCPSSSSCQTI